MVTRPAGSAHPQVAGGVHRALPVPGGEQPVAGVGVPGADLAGRARRPRRAGAARPGCGPRAGCRSARSTGHGCGPSAATAASARSSRWSASSRSRDAVRASAAATPGPRSRSRSARAPRARTRVKAGSSFIGSSHQVSPCARTDSRHCVAGHPEQGAAEAAAGGRHPGQRPCPGAAGEAEQHLLGLVVEGVPEQHGHRPVPVGGRLEGGVAGLAGGGLQARRPTPATSTVTHLDGVEAQVRGAAAPPAAATCAEPGCRPWSTTTAPARHPAAVASKARAAARASESAPPLHATRTRSPGTRSATAPRTATRTAAVAASGDPQRRSTAPILPTSCECDPALSRGLGGPRPRAPRSRGPAAGCPGTSRWR